MYSNSANMLTKRIPKSAMDPRQDEAEARPVGGCINVAGESVAAAGGAGAVFDDTGAAVVAASSRLCFEDTRKEKDED